MPPRKTKSLTFRLSEFDADLIERLAELEDLTVAAIVRRAVRAYGREILSAYDWDTLCDTHGEDELINYSPPWQRDGWNSKTVYKRFEDRKRREK